jgi:hypothetical protein
VQVDTLPDELRRSNRSRDRTIDVNGGSLALKSARTFPRKRMRKRLPRP